MLRLEFGEELDDRSWETKLWCLIFIAKGHCPLKLAFDLCGASHPVYAWGINRMEINTTLPPSHSLINIAQYIIKCLFFTNLFICIY